MTEDTKVQDNNVEGKPESELHAEQKPAEEAKAPEKKDRTTEQFEKLTKANQELKAELEKAKQAREESVLDSLKPKAMNPDFAGIPGLPGNLTPSEKKKLIDESGYLNADVLEQTIAEANKRAEQAEKDAKMARDNFVKYEETQQTKAAHEKYPELDPHSDSFDKDYYDLVKNEVFVQMARGEKDLLKAAAKIKKLYQSKVVEDKKAVVQEDQTDQKQQINAGKASSNRSGAYETTDDSDLIRATRKGKKGALAERLKRAGY
jgi:hypothetical protein